MSLMIQLTFQHMLRENKLRFVKRLAFSALRFYQSLGKAVEVRLSYVFIRKNYCLDFNCDNRKYL